MEAWKIKSLSVLNVHPTLAEIAEEVRAEFGFDIITSAYRPGDGGVHGTIPLRGLDLRCYSDTLGQSIADRVNSRWEYDPERPDKQCALYHDVGQGKHLHLQVHPRTRWRNEE